MNSTPLSAPLGAQSLAALTVLLIDDEAFMHELLAAMLRQIGVTRITTAHDGEQGIAALATAAVAPDIIICDLNMPGKDGFQVMEALAASRFQGGVILLSGLEQRMLNSAALMGRFHHLRVLGVVAKPVSKAALTKLLQSSVQTKGPSC